MLRSDRVWCSNKFGTDLLKIFNINITKNNGLYKDESELWYVEGALAEKGTNLSYEVFPEDIEEIINKYDGKKHVIIIGGRYCTESNIIVPTCHIFVTDLCGVHEKYKCKFKIIGRKQRIMDYELDKTRLIWSRDTK